MFRSLAIVAAVTFPVAQCQNSPAFANTTTNPFTNTTTASSPLTPTTVCDKYSVKCYTDITYVAAPIASTGSGGAYATSCQDIQQSYSSASQSWTDKHNSVEVQTETQGGTYTSVISYYKNASTLCDGHPRVTYSPAILESTSNATITAPISRSTATMTAGWAFPIESPDCSINPSDCNSLWAAYTTSVSQYDAQKTGASFTSQITASPETPFCINSTHESSAMAFSSSFYACGPCTIFGNGIELLYFPVPTTVSRDMCASTPSGTITSYADDVGTPYAGSGVPQTAQNGTFLSTAVLDGKTFTSGMAYISIASVWIGDRCTGSKGSAISSAIIALPSESLLTLRYSQNHFQYYQAQSSITGYPFNYADMQQPIPYSAWIGQTQCDGPDDPSCNVIYEHDFNPQLAMPPGIRGLNPDWATCNMWYGGLYDPPKALQPAVAVATATLPGSKRSSQSTAASPSNTLASSQPAATALSDTNDQSTYPVTSLPQQTQVASSTAEPSASQNPSTQASGSGDDTTSSNVYTGAVVSGAVISIANAAYTVTKASVGAVADGTTLTADGPAITINGVAVSMGHQCGCLEVGGSAVGFSALSAAAVPTPAHSPIAVVTFSGASGSAVTAYATPGSNGNVVLESATLSVGGAAETLGDGEVVSLATEGLVVQAPSTTFTHALPSTSEADNIGLPVTATLSVGGPAKTLSNGEVVSLASDGLIVQEAITTNSAQAFFDSVTLSLGGSAKTLSNGEVVSLGSDGLVIQAASTTISQALTSASTTAASSAGASSSSAGGRSSSHGITGTSTTQSVSGSGTSEAHTASSAATASSAGVHQFYLERSWFFCLALMSLCCLLV